MQLDTEFTRGLGLFDATMVVVGSMVGSGIFIVSADMARTVGAPGWLLAAWVVAGVLTVVGALSYGELAAMMPRAGGQYVYLREAFSPLWGFLYGWTLFLVIQTGTIAAVAVGFARYFGVLWPWIAEDHYLVAPVHLSAGYALSLSTTQLVGVLLIGLLTWTNTRGLEYGRIVQNVFTTAKTGAVVGLVVVGLTLGWNHAAVADNFGQLWTRRGFSDITPGVSASTAFGLFVAICVSQTGSLFSADAWNNITFTAGEVKEPRRNVPLSLALGTTIVIGLYLLANVAYLVTLPFASVQHAPSDRVATATLDAIFPGAGTLIMAVGIMISTFGCNNGLILAGARAYYAMARDGLFFKPAGVLNHAKVPAWALGLQGVWAAILVLPRTVRRGVARIREPVQQSARLRDFGRAHLLHPDNCGRVPAAADEARRGAAVPRVRLPGRAGSLHRGRSHHPGHAVRLSHGDDVARTRHCVAGIARVFRLAASPGLNSRHGLNLGSRPLSDPDKRSIARLEMTSGGLANDGHGHVGDAVIFESRRAAPTPRRRHRTHRTECRPTDGRRSRRARSDVRRCRRRPGRSGRAPRRSGPTSTSSPVSSRTSRATACSSVSPSSTPPPGRLHCPFSGSCARLISRTRSASRTTAPTPTTGRGG